MCGFGRRAGDLDHGDVVGLAEGACGLGDGADRGAIAKQNGGAVEAKEFARFALRFEDAVGVEGEVVARVQLEVRDGEVGSRIRPSGSVPSSGMATPLRCGGRWPPAPSDTTPG